MVHACGHGGVAVGVAGACARKCERARRTSACACIMCCVCARGVSTRPRVRCGVACVACVRVACPLWGVRGVWSGVHVCVRRACVCTRCRARRGACLCAGGLGGGVGLWCVRVCGCVVSGVRCVCLYVSGLVRCVFGVPVTARARAHTHACRVHVRVHVRVGACVRQRACVCASACVSLCASLSLSLSPALCLCA